MIISAFPGTGKSTIAKEYPTIFMDIDSSVHHKLEDGTKNPSFIDDYYNDIVKNMKDKHILVSSHHELLAKLKENNIDFIVVVPDIELRDHYLVKYHRRGNSDEFVQTLHDNWDHWIKNITSRYDNVLILKKHEYIIDYISFGENNMIQMKLNRALRRLQSDEQS